MINIKEDLEGLLVNRFYGIVTIELIEDLNIVLCLKIGLFYTWLKHFKIS